MNGLLLYIVTQTSKSGQHFYTALAENEIAAIAAVDETYGFNNTTYSARLLQEPVAYIASVMKPRKEQS